VEYVDSGVSIVRVVTPVIPLYVFVVGSEGIEQFDTALGNPKSPNAIATGGNLVTLAIGMGFFLADQIMATFPPQTDKEHAEGAVMVDATMTYDPFTDTSSVVMTITSEEPNLFVYTPLMINYENEIGMERVPEYRCWGCFSGPTDTITYTGSIKGHSNLTVDLNAMFGNHIKGRDMTSPASIVIDFGKQGTIVGGYSIFKTPDRFFPSIVK
jgi:hypothetical protein